MAGEVWLGPHSALARVLADWFYNSPVSQFVTAWLLIFVAALSVLLLLSVPLRLLLTPLSGREDRWARTRRYLGLVLSLMLCLLMVLNWRESLLGRLAWPALAAASIALAALAAWMTRRWSGRRLVLAALLIGAATALCGGLAGLLWGNGIVPARLAIAFVAGAGLVVLDMFRPTLRRVLPLVVATAALFAVSSAVVRPACTLDPHDSDLPNGALWELLSEWPAYGMALSPDNRYLFYSLKRRNMPEIYRLDRQTGRIESFSPQVGGWIVRLEFNPADGLLYSNGTPAPMAFLTEPLAQRRLMMLPEGFSGRRYDHILLDPQRGRLYASARMPGSLVSCDLRDGSTLAAANYENELVAPASLAWGPGRQSLYVAENRRGYFPGFFLAELDPDTLKLRRRKLLGPYNYGLVIDQRRNLAYVGQLLNGVLAVDLNSLEVVRFFHQPGIRELALDPATDRLYAADFFGGRVYALDPDTLQVEGELSCGCEARGLLPDGRGNILISSTYGVLFAPADAFLPID